MHKATITSKGQITVPAAVRAALGVGPGEKLVFWESDNGEFRVTRAGSFKDLYGYLASAGVEAPMTNAELNELMGTMAAALDESTKSKPKTAEGSEAA